MTNGLLRENEWERGQREREKNQTSIYTQRQTHRLFREREQLKKWLAKNKTEVTDGRIEKGLIVKKNGKRCYRREEKK